MKKFVLFGISLLLAAGMAAQGLLGGQVTIKELDVARNEGTLFVTMDMDVEALRLKSNHEMVLTPALVTVDKTVAMPSVVVAGRNSYYHYLRNGEQLGGRGLYRAGKTGTIQYQASLPYEKWMETAELVLL